MKTRGAIVLMLGGLLGIGAGETAGPSRDEVESEMGLRSEGDLVRGQLDTVGFVVTRQQTEEVVRLARTLEEASLEAGAGLAEGAGLVGAVCPHDDHLYAGRVYVHVTQQITAPRVLLVGVFHRARLWDLEGRLVFDRFQAWHGPWQPVPVDPIRDELLAALPPESVVVSNAMHCREHSLEAIVPFLQARTREVTIVPVLVPYLTWEQLDRLSGELAEALAATLERHGWELGRDLALVISSDAVHYGDDFDHVPFGTDVEAYRRATERDRLLARTHLEGSLEADALKRLLHTLVDRDDVRSYRLPWCGRFSIPFGLETLRKTADLLGRPAPVGTLLRYGTSLSEAELPVSDAVRKSGLGYTAPSNLHHWVGYASVGYRWPEQALRQ